MKKSLIIFGNKQIAELAHYYFAKDSNYEVVAFTADDAFVKENTFLGLPLLPFSTLATQYTPERYQVFVALAYSNINQLRKEKYLGVKAAGYTLASYVSSKASILCDREKIGENCFILEDNTLQPFVRIGNNVTLWSGNHIGHHSRIEDHCFISSHVVVSGNVTVKERCFIGVNATLRNDITIGVASVIGAGCWINKDLGDESVCTAKPADLRKQKSSELSKI